MGMRKESGKVFICRIWFISTVKSYCMKSTHTKLTVSMTRIPDYLLSFYHYQVRRGLWVARFLDDMTLFFRTLTLLPNQSLQP